MFPSNITRTPETRQPVDSQEPRSLESTPAAKAFKFAAYGALAYSFGCLTALATDRVQSYFNQPAADFLDQHYFANDTHQWINYHELRDEHQTLSFFAQALISGSITLAAHVFMNNFLPTQTSAPPTPSNTENQPAQSQSAANLIIANKRSKIV
ncbi:hypothetical protein [Salinisphaera sp. G21_0]|uniref:hypothetical protein n=1 Tax=Salinisphaera sp. G21_0 TaxID=2821094 RepID=UPI001ADCEE58|nr:hypothetical protein [Salinisphaera sp. G21_0]MBO9479945.1 hypothetical protein [Salinisphaera sp. G21_0]